MYHMLDEDLDSVKELGVDAFRFSLSWPRILPEWGGRKNQKGIDFYKRYLEGLQNGGISPWVTLYHWDLPQALEDKGGWQNPDIADWFSEYCAVIHEELGDYIQNIVLVNEPSMISFFGYGTGIHAPGISDEDAYFRSAHNVNRSIKKGYQTLKGLNPAYLGLFMSILKP